ncbi:MAG: hypothetical protein RR277_00350 [Rikenellaceae bacterium]
MIIDINAPRSRMYDILDRLKKGDIKKIAQRSGCSVSMVSAVLNGKCNQTTRLAMNVLRVAEEMTRIAWFRK